MKYNTFGDPTKALRYMAIDDHLRTISSENRNILAFCIAHAIYRKVHIVKICQFILGVAERGEDAVIDIIGEECFLRIKKNLKG